MSEPRERGRLHALTLSSFLFSHVRLSTQLAADCKPNCKVRPAECVCVGGWARGEGRCRRDGWVWTLLTKGFPTLDSSTWGGQRGKACVPKDVRGGGARPCVYTVVPEPELLAV